MDDGNVKDMVTPREMEERLSQLEKELQEKRLENYKIKKLVDMGLKPSYAGFLKGGTEEEFEQSLITFLEEGKKASVSKVLGEVPRSSGNLKLSEDEKIKDEIIAIGKKRIQ